MFKHCFCLTSEIIYCTTFDYKNISSFRGHVSINIKAAINAAFALLHYLSGLFLFVIMCNYVYFNYAIV